MTLVLQNRWGGQNERKRQGTGCSIPLQLPRRSVISTLLLLFFSIHVCYTVALDHKCTFYLFSTLSMLIAQVKFLRAAEILWTAAKLCFLFDTQQVTVSAMVSSALQRVHHSNVSGDDATHGALLKLFSYLRSILMLKCRLHTTNTYKRCTHTKHLSHSVPFL